MSINYNVQADVIDIKTDNPRKEDIFLVDTNVWYWQTYTKASILSTSYNRYQHQEYPAYLSKALSANSLLSYCGLSLVELVHNIERSEREISIRQGTIPNNTKPKQYRHNYPQDRSNVIFEIQLACLQVKAIAAEIEISIENKTINQALNRLQTQLLDGYDLLILEAMQEAKINSIITDDGDYVTVPNIRIFTANKNVITAARNQGKLVIR